MPIVEAVQSEPVYVFTENPKGWLKSSLPQHKDHLQNSSEDLIGSQAKRWQEITGVLAEDTQFTIIVPIHDEEKFLPSFLGSLMLTDFPYSAKINILLITNACTDQSWQITDSFLDRLGGKADSQQLSLDDPLLRQSAKVVYINNLSLFHLDTATRGKANALRIGNRMALNAGHQVAISVDANNFMEPNALANLYSCANRCFQSEEEKVVLLSSYARGERRPAKLNRLLDLGLDLKQNLSRQSVSVNGWMMAWRTSWLESIGGPPPVAIEDYALGVMARKGNFEIGKVEQAVVWGFMPNNFKDLLSSRVRYIRGRLQLIDYDPSVENLIREDYYFMRSTLVERLVKFLQEVDLTKIRGLRQLVGFLIWEYALGKAKKEYCLDPHNQSWEPILSTK